MEVNYGFSLLKPPKITSIDVKIDVKFETVLEARLLDVLWSSLGRNFSKRIVQHVSGFHIYRFENCAVNVQGGFDIRVSHHFGNDFGINFLL